MQTPACPTITRFSATILALIIGATLAVPAVFAQSSTRLTAIPTRYGDDLTLSVAPGQSEQVSLRVKNESDQPITIVSLAQDFILDEDGRTPIPVENTVDNRWSLASWVTLAPATQEIAPGEVVNLAALIEVPEDALPGGHYAMILHQPVADLQAGLQIAAQSEGSASVTQKVGTLLYVKVEGPINYQAFIRNFAAPSFTEFGPVPFSYVMENQSDIHIRPRASIQIKNIFGRVVDTVEVEPKNIFPLMEREFEANWNRTWGFGPYTAILTASYSDGGQIISSATRFWLFPITIVLVGLILFLILVIAFMAIRRHWIHRNDDSQARIRELEEKVQTLQSDQLKQFEEE